MPKGGRGCGLRCPIWVQGTLGEDYIRQSLALTAWESATELVRDWEVAGKIARVNGQTTAAGAEVERSASSQGFDVMRAAPTAEPLAPSAAESVSTEPLPPAIAGCVEAYLRDCKARQLAPAGIGKYRTLLKTHLLPFCVRNELHDLSQLTLTVLRTFREAWTFAPITHAKNLERLRTFLRFCVASGWISTNPAVALKPPKVRHHPTLPFEDEECQRLLEAIERWRFGTGKWAENGRRTRALFLVLRYTGLRISDALVLRRSDVADQRIFLYQAKTGHPVCVPVPPDVTNALKTLAGGGPYYFWRGATAPRSLEVEYAYQVWRRKLLALARHVNLGGHPKPAINRHLKTGHSFTDGGDRDVDRDEGLCAPPSPWGTSWTRANSSKSSR